MKVKYVSFIRFSCFKFTMNFYLSFWIFRVLFDSSIFFSSCGAFSFSSSNTFDYSLMHVANYPCTNPSLSQGNGLLILSAHYLPYFVVISSSSSSDSYSTLKFLFSLLILCVKALPYSVSFSLYMSHSIYLCLLNLMVFVYLRGSPDWSCCPWFWGASSDSSSLVISSSVESLSSSKCWCR